MVLFDLWTTQFHILQCKTVFAGGMEETCEHGAEVSSVLPSFLSVCFLRKE